MVGAAPHIMTAISNDADELEHRQLSQPF